MSNKEIIVRIKEYLNKLDSADYDNIECWQIMSAFNKAQLDFVRKQLSGYNLRRQGDEASKINIDDLEILLTTIDIDIEKKDRYYESIDTLPEDYNQFKRVKANSLMECCPKRPLKIHLEQVADVEDMLVDSFFEISSNNKNINDLYLLKLIFLLFNIFVFSISIMEFTIMYGLLSI